VAASVATPFALLVAPAGAMLRRMDVHEALYTTRAMRRCRPDKIPMDVQQRILDAAVRAPTGGNTQNWRFMLVDDDAVKAKLGPVYRRCLAMLWQTVYKERVENALADPDSEDSKEMLKIQRSAQHLADHFEEYPLLLFSFVQFDPTGGSIFPATWSAMLAARAEGVGSSLTSVFMFELDVVLETLGVPKEDGWLFSSCVTMGYPTGVWGVAPRRPVHEVSYRNQWGADVGFTIDAPLWPAS
jgi:nitroreductase